MSLNGWSMQRSPGYPGERVSVSRMADGTMMQEPQLAHCQTPLYNMAFCRQPGKTIYRKKVTMFSSTHPPM